MEFLSNKENIFLGVVKQNINGKIVCFDIGANKGFYSSALIEKLGDNIERLYCFEPVEENIEYCISKFADNSKIELHQKACSNQKISKIFYQVIHKELAYEGLSSLNNRHIFQDPGLKIKEINVDCIILDDFLDIKDKNIFAKIDVEGHELEVLEGMTGFFTRGEIYGIQFEYGNCMLEQNKDLNNIIYFLNEFPEYDIFDFDEYNKSVIKIDNSNISNYISLPWCNLYILKTKSWQK